MIKDQKIAINSFLIMTFLHFSPLLSAEELNEALNLSVEDLLNTQVTSVAKKAQSLNDAAAAVFVISNEDIKRSGVTSIPEALRLAPGMDVARIDSNKWAISARGFNGRFANKLQVLIDGRSLYTRSFSGVYWENQDIMLEDIDRIEVIRGPGATLWGANAVNGVINIITKSSSETQGALLNAGGGTEEQGFGSLRYGTKFGENTSARAYVKGFQRDQNTLQSGIGANDSWSKVQGGFRLDSVLSDQDNLTVQGDIYQTQANQYSYYNINTQPFQIFGKESNRYSGGNVLGRLQHTFSLTSDYSLQFYYDTYSRSEVPYDESRDTLDLEFQHRFALFDWHEIIWGLNYRFGHDHIVGNLLQNGSPNLTINPTSVNDQVYSGFVQDELTLIDNKLWLTLGSKFEHNDYSGFEGQPSARIMWAPYNQHRLWAGVSRSVRTPSRAEQDASVVGKTYPPNTQLPLSLPVVAQIQGNPNFLAEEVITYETGYRTTFSKSVSLDVTGFYNDYRDLRYVTPGTPFYNGSAIIVPAGVTNNLRVKTYGIEVATVWQMLDWWRWDANYSWLHTQMDSQFIIQAGESPSPEQRVSIRSVLTLGHDIDLDFWGRYVDNNVSVSSLGNTAINSYITLDLRLAWRPYKDLELSLVGQNLLTDKHLEYVKENQTLPTAIDRGMYGKMSWSF